MCVYKVRFLAFLIGDRRLLMRVFTLLARHFINVTLDMLLDRLFGSSHILQTQGLVFSLGR